LFGAGEEIEEEIERLRYASRRRVSSSSPGEIAAFLQQGDEEERLVPDFEGGSGSDDAREQFVRGEPEDGFAVGAEEGAHLVIDGAGGLVWLPALFEFGDSGQGAHEFLDQAQEVIVIDHEFRASRWVRCGDGR
jgi:hypothetical protein